MFKFILCLSFLLTATLTQNDNNAIKLINSLSDLYYLSRQPSCEDLCYGNQGCISGCHTQKNVAWIIVGCVVGAIALCVGYCYVQKKCEEREERERARQEQAADNSVQYNQRTLSASDNQNRFSNQLKMEPVMNRSSTPGQSQPQIRRNFPRQSQPQTQPQYQYQQ